jgi:hypothetical protein
MNLQQLHSFKRWHLTHLDERSLELVACNLVLTAWLIGWILLLTFAVLDAWPLLPASLALTLVPRAYWRLRGRLHDRGVLRCDWLAALGTGESAR